MKGWIRDLAGVRTPLTAKGVVIGRADTCTVVLDDRAVSRHHVLILPTSDAALVLPLGKKAVELRGQSVSGPTTAKHGDVLKVGSARFELELELEVAAAPWLLSVAGVRYPIRKPLFTVGGGPEDDLVISSWPTHTCTLHMVNQALHLETLEACAIDGADARGEGHRLKKGARFSRQGVEVELVEAPDGSDTYDDVGLPTRIELEFVPDGALLRVELRGERTVYLPQKRADLVAALLKPPGSLVAGEWVDDEVLLPLVWGSEAATRNQINVLIHRTRCSLTEAGLDGPALIERAPGGLATRFRLASPPQVRVL